MTINCKTPVTYYGGKQRMLEHILPLIPEHRLYAELFFGGGAVYFAKEPSAIEVINDRDDFVINFYRVLKLRFDELKAEVEASLSSRSIHRKANYIYRNPDLYCELKKAWALWYLACNSFSGKLSGGWKYDRVENKDAQVLVNRKVLFNDALVRRIEHTQIESEDAIKVLMSRDCRHAFFYIDPPYIDSDQGHYAGYTHQMFINLLEALAVVKGKFMLSCFPGDIIMQYAAKYGWIVKSFDKVNYSSRTTHESGVRKKGKTELLVMNYVITSKQLTAF